MPVTTPGRGDRQRRRGRRGGSRRTASGRTPTPPIQFTAPRKPATKRDARAQVDVLGRAHLLDAAFVHDGELVGHGERLLLVVRHEQEGDAGAALHGLQFEAHLLAQFGIERGEGLVEQQDVGLQDQGAGEGHALALAAGELRGTARLPCR